ncbi:hypothetical protein [Streptosporangium fragile]|uniref:hypothetical protein n=1 Tax=Streptosporangium fragile TaxID=46186 RepID=UPI0031E52E3B
MSRRTSAVAVLSGILVAVIAMVTVVWMFRSGPHDLGPSVVVDGKARGGATGGASSGPAVPGDPDASGGARTTPDAGPATPTPRLSATVSRRAEPVEPPPPPRGGGDDDDDGDNDGGDDDGGDD